MDKKQAYTEGYLSAFELRFFSALPLDEAIKCLEKLPPEYELKIITEDADDCRFEIRYGNRRFADAAMGRGTLRRWEGTFTRVDCEGQILSKKLRPKEPKNPRDYLPALALLLGSIFLVSVGIPFIFYVSPILGAVLILVGFPIFWRFAHNLPPYMNPMQRMFNALKTSFASAGIVADTPDDLVHQLTPPQPDTADGEIVMVEDILPFRQRDER
jgi:hypothetical protein